MSGCRGEVDRKSGGGQRTRVDGTCRALAPWSAAADGAMFPGRILPVVRMERMIMVALWAPERSDGVLSRVGLVRGRWRWARADQVSPVAAPYDSGYLPVACWQCGTVSAVYVSYLAMTTGSSVVY